MTIVKVIAGFEPVKVRPALLSAFLASLLLVGPHCSLWESRQVEINPGDRIVLIGNNLGSRMMYFGHFETEMHLRFPGDSLLIRNMSVPGDTPGFRPHAGRNSPWAFPGAEQFHPQLAADTESEGHFPTPDEWITSLRPNVVIAFFGYNESFAGAGGVETYKAELDAFIRHTLTMEYNGDEPVELVMVSPTAFEDLSHRYNLPDGTVENENLRLYTEAIREAARRHDVRFVDVFHPTNQWFETTAEPVTIDGFQLNGQGYERFAVLLADRIFGSRAAEAEEHRDLVHSAVLDKNWMWHNDYKIPNGVHAYGRRFEPFGPDNYPAEIEKIRQMTAIRDTAIWMAARGEIKNVAAADEHTLELPPVETNFNPEVHGSPVYRYGQDALDRFALPEGYQIELFASEEDFPDLANPVQLTFDNQGRLWVATMPSYPHYKPGDTRPDDKLMILEDTSGDGRADTRTIFAGGLHLPLGFEFVPEGVLVSQGPNMVLLRDTTGNDRADTYEIILSGFDDHDTHHAHSTYTLDPSGAIYMGEGVFLHSNIETPYGPVRASNGGFFRYDHNRRHLERTSQVSIPNPWGIAFDEWGQNFFAETSGPDVRWMMPGTIRPRYGVFSPKSPNLIENAHLVRPTSGLEFVSSRHFPDEVQGDLLIANTIGFLGIKQHVMEEEGTGYDSRHRHDLLVGTDRNFRPVDMEFAPDGSLYLVDWHNVLIGHMQHNARDPLRDHVHGRIYRITYPARPLLEPAPVAGADIAQLFENLKLPEFRTRDRSRRELRARNASEVLDFMSTWIAELDSDHERYEHRLLEALWVSWGLNQVDEDLLRRLLRASDHRVRAAAVRAVRYNGHQLPDQTDLLVQAAGDEHGRVRLEAIVAASWLDIDAGMAVLNEAANHPLDEWMAPIFEASMAHLIGEPVGELIAEEVETNLEGEEREMYLRGRMIYARDGYCGTCHQPDGMGLPAAGFPPLADTRWVTGNDERLIRLTLDGMAGPIEVRGVSYPGDVPMTPFRGLLDDDEIAAVLTYIRNAFGNEADAVSPERVAEVRAATSDRRSFYTADELMQMFPLED